MNWANALKKAVHEQTANAITIAAIDSSTFALAAVEPILSGHLDYRCLVFGTRKLDLLAVINEGFLALEG